MSEAVAVKPLPSDYPIVEPLQKGVNIRKAMAGIHLLNGEGSQLRCLMKAGYSRATARTLGAKGLDAKACIAEAAKLDSMANPAKMLEAGRARAMLAIQACEPTTVPLKDAMKMLDTVEKYYGGHAIEPSNAILGVTERLASIVSLLVVAQQRGLPVPAIPREYIEAQEVSQVATEAVPQNDSVVSDSKQTTSFERPISSIMTTRNKGENPKDINPNF